MKKTMQVRWGSVKRIGITSDYREAVKQYVWNALEAGARNVNIVFKPMAKDLPPIKSFYIEDDGRGIAFEDLEETFGSFLESKKEVRFTKGGKGKGRLSFMCFASKATWHTTYESDDGMRFYTIAITEADRQNYEYEKPKSIEGRPGTRVVFTLPKKTINMDLLNSDDFEQYLALEFGWYLAAHSSEAIMIKRNGVAINYKKYIVESQTFPLAVSDGKTPEETYDFNVNFVQWSEKIGTESYFYLLDSKHSLIDRKTTGFNTVGGRAYGFVHSLYIQSDYFNDFIFTNTPQNDPNTKFDLAHAGAGIDQTDQVYKKLLKFLKDYLQKKRDDFLRADSETAMERFKERGTLPTFRDDPLGKSQEEDYIHVVKGIYRTAPSMFVNLNEQHEKSILGLLNLTLKSDEREHVLNIVNEVVELNPQEREELSSLLKNAKLSGVIKLLKTLELRYSVVELIKELVFKHTKTATERGQLQQAIESNCWIFGEEYNLIGADSSFTKLRDLYFDFISKSSSSVDVNDRRPDVFISRSKKISSGMSGSGQKLQNLIIELKRPSVSIGIQQYRQLEDYMHIIQDSPDFMSEIREWHMYIVGKKIESDVLSKRKAFEHLNRQFLVYNETNFYIYAVSWAEIFDCFTVRHDYLLNDLDIDKVKILEGIKSKYDLDAPQVIADKVSSIGTEELATAPRP